MINLGLALSDTPDFSRPRNEILSPPVIDLWNISNDQIPANVDDIDGSHNGKDYVAMTVYLKNMGSKNLHYNLYVDLNEVYKNLDEALRIELFIDGTPTIYAKRKSNWSNEPEPGTTPFSGITRVIALATQPIDVDQVVKVTFVAWVDGDDPDCTNDLLGGFVKMTMGFDGVVRDQASSQ